MMVKRFLCIITAMLLLFCCNGCRSADVLSISCSDIVLAYEEAGYTVFHKDVSADDQAYVCYVKAEDQISGEYIFFHFFDTEEAASAYEEAHRWNVILWLYSAASSHPYWLRTETYGNIEYEYADQGVLQPFRELIE